MKTERKARKEHECELCDFPILKNTIYVEEKIKLPVTDENNCQIGIEYLFCRYHIWCNGNLLGWPDPEFCEKHVCQWETDYYNSGCQIGVPTGYKYCRLCYALKKDE